MDDLHHVDEQLAQYLGPYFLQRITHNGEVMYKVSLSTLKALCNEIFGVDNWRHSERDVSVEHKLQTGTCTELLISVVVSVELSDGTCREDVGYGSAKDQDPQVAASKALEYARQSGLTRCLRQFGNALGNCINPKYTQLIEKQLKHELQ